MLVLFLVRGGRVLDFVPDLIRKICANADTRLWEASARSTGVASVSPAVSRLVFPTYSGSRAGQLRVSEQEARFAFVEALQQSGSFYYSVETPTREAYQLTGSKPLAQS